MRRFCVLSLNMLLIILAFSQEMPAQERTQSDDVVRVKTKLVQKRSNGSDEMRRVINEAARVGVVIYSLGTRPNTFGPGIKRLPGFFTENSGQGTLRKQDATRTFGYFGGGNRRTFVFQFECARRWSWRSSVLGKDGRFIKWSKVLPLPPGLYQVRVAVRDRQTGRTGSALTWLEIPQP